MKRIATLLSVCLIAVSFAAAQATLPGIKYTQNTDDEDDEYEEGNTDFNYGMTLSGDQYIRIALGANFPLNFPDFGSVIDGSSKLKIGGAGTLGYHSFISEKVAIGVDLGFGFNLTVGSHSFNTVPILFTTTFEPSFKRFSFPLSLGAGIAWESYNGKNYFPGLALKPQGGVHFRITESWTAGLETAYLFLTQFNALYESGARNRFGHFWTIDLVARYMF